MRESTAEGEKGLSVDAVIWDFDGTIVDTREKNLRVCRRIVEDLTGRRADDFEALRSLARYEQANRRAHNWRDLYRNDLGLSEEEVDTAGAMWGEYQERDGERAPLYEGIAQVIASLASLPQGIVSQNSRHEILRALRAAALESHFSHVIGHDDVSFGRQKPHPDGLVACMESLMRLRHGRPQPGRVVLFIGDHEVDAACAHNANRDLEGRGIAVRVVSIAVSYGHGSHPEEWEARPDHIASHAVQLGEIAHDWMSGRYVSRP